MDKQWSSHAEQNSPEIVEGLEEQKEKLQKALEKAEKRLEERKHEPAALRPSLRKSLKSWGPIPALRKKGQVFGNIVDWRNILEIQDFLPDYN